MTASNRIVAMQKEQQRRSAVRPLPLAEWPPSDRLAWEDACRPGNRLARGGSASRFAQDTRQDLEQRYGYFLDFLDRVHKLDKSAQAAAQVTPEAIDGFIAELRVRVSSVTLAGTIYKVRRMGNLISPQQDLTWLMEIEKDLALMARPKDKSARIVASEMLVAAGLALIAQAGLGGGQVTVSRALMARNGLMVALLGVAPIRLRDFAALETGHSFVNQHGTWWIVLRDTKTGRPDERPVPDWLNDAIGCYLETYRPVLLAARPTALPPAQPLPAGTAEDSDQRSSALWIGHHGRPLSRAHVARCVSDTTRSTVGIDVSLHLFRAAGATTAALHAPDMPHLASALLHHRDRSVTEQHYNRASSLSVAVDYTKLVRGLK